MKSVFKDYILVRNRLWSDTAHISILAPPFLPLYLGKVSLTILGYFLTFNMVMIIVPTGYSC